jgi:hypothetical protein
MRGAIILIVAVVVLGYLGVKFGTMVKSKSDLTERVDYRLDFVDETSIAAVKQDLVHDAQRLGIELVPDNIDITYTDTERRTLPQKLLEGRVAQFVNKQVAIKVRYVVRILGVPFHQEISNHKIKQVQAQRVEPNSGLVPSLDGTE